MCTAIRLPGKFVFFGRNLDLEYHYNECVAVAPRGFGFDFRHGAACPEGGYAMIGVATPEGGYPLYYDAVNEHGLAAAGLNFVGNAVYSEPRHGMVNLAAFEFIPYMLSVCRSVDEAKEVLTRVNITHEKFNESMGIAHLHFMLSDKSGSIVAEPMEGGMRVYENPADVLTNDPPFDYHMQNLTLFRGMSASAPENLICQSESDRERLPLSPISHGTGGIGIPGDLSSPSRFIRAAFGRLCSVKKESEEGALSQILHILASVAQTEGLVHAKNAPHKTVYTSAANLDTGTYFVTTYDNSRPTAYALTDEAVHSSHITCYPIMWSADIKYIT